MATAKHVVGVANSSLVHLLGMAEQALVANASHVAAAGTVKLRDAIAACQPDSRVAVTPHPSSTPAAAPLANPPMEEEPTLQAASNAAPP